MTINPQTNLFIIILFLVWFYGQAGFGLREIKKIKGKF